MPQYDDEVSVIELWRRLMKYKISILSVTLAVTFLSIVTLLLITPVYRSTVVMVAAEQDESAGLLGSLADQFGGLAAIAGLNIGEKSNVNEAIAVLKSRTFTEQFILEENLMPVLFYDDWNADSNDWRSQDPEEIPSLWDAYELFDTEIRIVEQDVSSGLITLYIDWVDPKLAAEWSNLIIAKVNRKIREDVIAESEASLEYLNKELSKTDIVGLQQAIYRLTEAQLQRIMLANVRDEYAFKVIDPGAQADIDEPIRPQKILILLIGFFGGLLLGIFVAVIRDLAQRTPDTDQ